MPDLDLDDPIAVLKEILNATEGVDSVTAGNLAVDIQVKMTVHQLRRFQKMLALMYGGTQKVIDAKVNQQ